MEVVNKDRHMSYICFPEINPAMEEAGRKILKAFDVRERFFHIELFETKDDRVIALEVNMRPPGAWMTDAINYTFDIDVYAAWADMVVKDAAGGPYEGKYFTAYASRKRHLHYLHSHEDVLAAHRRQDRPPSADRRGFQPRHGKLRLPDALEGRRSAARGGRLHPRGKGVRRWTFPITSISAGNLGRDMEYKRYGHAGRPVVVFPTSQGRFYQFEDSGGVGALAEFIDTGRIQLFAVDGIDCENPSSTSMPTPPHRIARHEAYFRYVREEALPEILRDAPSKPMAGAS